MDLSVGDFGCYSSRRCLYAEVAKLADALDLGSSAARRAGSIPVLGTNIQWTVVGGQLSDRTIETGHYFFEIVAEARTK